MEMYLISKGFTSRQVNLFSFAKRTNPGIFFIPFRYFQTISQNKTYGLRVIRTRIVRVEGKHADHLTTTLEELTYYLIFNILDLI